VTADKTETDLQQTRIMAERLGNALGPELAQKMGQSRLDDWAVKIRQAGVSADQLDENIDDIAASIKRVDAATGSLDTLDTKMRQVGDTTDRTGSVTANYLGNAAQELPMLTGAFGPLNMAVGQFVEYSAEGGINLKNFAKGAGLIGVATAAMALLSARAESAAAAQARLDARTDEVSDSLEDQARKAYELAAANASAEGSLDGLTIASQALNKAITLSGPAGETLTQSLGALGMSAEQGLDSIAKMRTGTSEFIEELVRGTGAFKGYEAQIAGAIAKSDDWGELVNSLDWEAANENIPKVTEAQLALIKAIEGVQDVAEETDLQAITKQYLDGASAATEEGRALVLLAEANLNGTTRAEDALAVYAEFNRILAESDAVTRDAILGTNEYGQAFDAASEAGSFFQGAIDDAKAAVEEHIDTINDAIDSTYDYEGASLDLADAVADQAAAQAEADAILNDSTKTDEEKAAALRDLRRAQISSAESALEASRAYATEQGALAGTPQFAQLQITALEQMRAKYPELESAISSYIAKLQSIPSVVNTNVGFSGQSGSGGGSKYTPGGPMKLEGLDGMTRGGSTLNVSVTVNGVVTGAQVGQEIANALQAWWNDGGTADWARGR